MKNEDKYYIYAYLDPSKKLDFSYKNLQFSFLFEPFYIGKGKNNRYISHLRKHRLSKKTYLSNKINFLFKNEINPIVIKLFDNLSEKEAFDIEKNLIVNIGRKNNKTGPLVNITEGGGGVSGLKHTLESRVKMSNKGESHPNWNKHLSESTREKISNKLKLNNPMKNSEVSERVRLKNLGRVPCNKGKKTSLEVCKKLSEKKIKYRNIKMISKNNQNEVTLFLDIYDAVSSIGKCYRSIYLYLQKGESKDHYWTHGDN